MILRADEIARELEKPENQKDPLVISPRPDLNELRKRGAASLDLRLGRWFLEHRANRAEILNVYSRKTDVPHEAKLSKEYYVRFGGEFILHPKAFVLGATIEWIRLPANRAAYVIGRSSWGRYGLVIATATGVHPGFTGCLTLELSNIGDIPIKVTPGTTICQIFIHMVEVGPRRQVDQSSFVGRRKPILGGIEPDKVARELASGKMASYK